MKRLPYFLLAALVLILAEGPLSAQTYDLRMIRDSVSNNELYAKVQIKADVSFKLGSTALFFDYNTATLDSPVVSVATNYVGFMTAAPCLSGFCLYDQVIEIDNTVGRTGLGIDLIFANAGADVPLMWTDILQLRFPIIDSTGNVEVSWRDPECLGEEEAVTVVKRDDDITTVCADELIGMTGTPQLPPNCQKDAFEPNDEQLDAANLFGGAFGSGDMRICPSFDVDWFKFTNTHAGRTISVKLSNLPANYNVELYDGGGLIASSNNPGTMAEDISLPNAPAGTYFVRVYGQDGAFSASTAYYLVVNLILPTPSGTSPTKPNIKSPIFKKDLQANLKVYPNPASSRFTAEFLAPVAETVEVTLTDAFGRIIDSREWELSTGINKLDWNADDLSEGIYMLDLKGSSASWSEKVLVVEE